jgi:hypothetical protein
MKYEKPPIIIEKAIGKPNAKEPPKTAKNNIKPTVSPPGLFSYPLGILVNSDITIEDCE